MFERLDVSIVDAIMRWLMSLLRQHIWPSSKSSLSFKIDATQLATVLRQTVHASSTLKRLGAGLGPNAPTPRVESGAPGGSFFGAVVGLFEARMEQHCREMLDAALLSFHSELGRYDWVASTAMASGAPETGWLHPRAGVEVKA